MPRSLEALFPLILTLCALPLAAQGPAAALASRAAAPKPDALPEVEPPLVAVPQLSLDYGEKSVVAIIDGPLEFQGVLLLSATSELRHFYVGLPPLLAEAQVYGVAKAQGGRIKFVLPLPPGPLPLVYGQALILDGGALRASAVVSLGPPEPQ